MGCPHEVWEREAATTADGICPLCLASQLDLTRRRLADSERIRTGLVRKLHELADLNKSYRAAMERIGNYAFECAKELTPAGTTTEGQGRQGSSETLTPLPSDQVAS